MLSVLAMTHKGEGTGILRRISDEGNITKVYFSNGRGEDFFKRSGVKVVTNPIEASESADLILYLNTGFGRIAKDLDSTGRMVLGGGRGQEFFVTPIGQNAVQTILNSNFEGMGIIVKVIGFYDQGFKGLFFVSFPYMQLMDGEKGEVTPGVGGITIQIDKESKLVKESLDKLEILLKTNEYKGFFGLMLVVGEDAFVPIGPIVALGVSFPVEIFEFFKQSTSDFLFNCAKGEELKIAYSNNYTGSVGLSLPPYPHDFNYKYNGVKFLDIKHPAILKHIYIEDLKGVSTNFLGWVTARGINLTETRRRLYRTISNIVCNSEVRFREDIGLRKQNAEECINFLVAKGWINAIIEREQSKSYWKEHSRVSPQLQENREDRECFTQEYPESPEASNSNSAE